MFSGSESRWDFEYTQIAVSMVGALNFRSHVSSIRFLDTKSMAPLGLTGLSCAKQKLKLKIWAPGHLAHLLTSPHISSHLLTSPHISSHLLTSPHISSHLLLVILPRSRSESAHGAHVCKAFLSLCLKDLERLFHTVPSYYSERILWVCAKLCTRLNLSGLGLSLAVETGRGWDPRRYQASEAARLPMMWCDFPKFGIFPRHFPIGVIPCGLALILQFFQQVFVGSAWSCLGKNWRVRTQPDGFKKNSFATHFHAFVWRSPTNPVTWASLTSMLGRTYRS